MTTFVYLKMGSEALQYWRAERKQDNYPDRLSYLSWFPEELSYAPRLLTEHAQIGGSMPNERKSWWTTLHLSSGTPRRRYKKMFPVLQGTWRNHRLIGVTQVRSRLMRHTPSVYHWELYDYEMLFMPRLVAADCAVLETSGRGVRVVHPAISA